MKKNPLFAVLLYVFCLFNSLSLLGQEPYYWQLTDDNGLPSMTIYKVIQDKKGLIWMATANGLCNFDGKQVTKVETSVLNDQEILKIKEGPDGKIWGINLSGQLFYYDKKQVVIIDKTYYNDINKVLDLDWVEDKLFFINRFGPSPQTNLADNKVYSRNIINKVTPMEIIAFNNSEKRFHKVTLNANIFLNEENSLNYYILMSKSENKLFAITSTSKLGQVHSLNSSNRDSILLKFEFPKGEKSLLNSFIWNNSFYFDYPDGQYKIDINNPSEMKKIVDIKTIHYFSNNDELYMIRNSGLSIIDKTGRSFDFFKNYKFNNAITDREGNLWLATNGKGGLIVPNIKVKLFNKSNSVLKSDEIYSLNKIDEDNIFIGKEDKAITKYTRANLSNVNINYQSRILSILRKDNDGFWIGGNEGVIETDKNFNILNKPITAANKSLYKSKNGYLYFATSLYFGIILNPKTHKLISYTRTYGITESRNGLIWFGSTNGLFTYDGLNVYPFLDTKTNTQTPYNITALKTDSTDRIWATTHGHGVLMIKNGKVEKILNKDNGMPTNSFNCVFTENNYTWLGSDKGVFRYDINTHEILHLNKYYGIPTDEILSLCTNYGNLLVGTSKGLTVIPFETIKLNLVAPNIHLLNVKINEIDRNRDIVDYTLNYQENNIFLEYISYQYRSKGDARYEYRIMELDTNWTVTTERSLRFTSLSSGHYHFQLRAINENRVRSDTTIYLHFYIKKPFWLEWWFYLGLFALGGTLVWWFLKRQFSTKMKFEDLRMQALQSQMNPHFIFNSLNAIQHFLTNNDDENATRFLSRFARLIRIVFEYNKKKEITFAEEIEMLETYLSLEKLRFNEKVDIHFKVDEKLELLKEEILLPPLLIQPIIENCFKHGLFHKQDKGNLWISFELYDNRRIKCIIEDDGVGRDRAKELAIWKGKHTSSGMSATLERVDFWHKKNNTYISNFFTIEDLTENNIAKGTRVTLIL
jgi:ligand-binding sensor domain-containing protein